MWSFCSQRWSLLIAFANSAEGMDARGVACSATGEAGRAHMLLLLKACALRIALSAVIN